MRIFVSIVTIAGCLVGCSLAVDLERLQGAAEAPRDASCAVRLFRDYADLGGECELIARMTLRDTGFTLYCGSDRIREEIREAVCAVGGDVAVLHRVPSPMSTCVQSDAEIYRCDAKTNEATAKQPESK